MSDDKRFEPSPSRLRKARQDGDVARSSELCGAVAFGCGLLGTVAVAPGIAQMSAGWLARPVQMTRPMAAADWPFLGALVLVPALAAALGGASAAVFQARSLSMTFKVSFDKLHPAQGFKRMLSREALISALRSSLAVLAIGAALWPVIRESLALAVGRHSVAALAAHIISASLRAIAVALGVGLLFALADFAVVRAAWLRRLRMSFEEMRRDQKEQDGDPHQRGRRSSAHRALIAGSISRVKEAAVVITNPTHIAIALAYDPPRIAVPRVLVRAADEGAARVRAAAREHGVPLVENVSLARALFAAAKPGDPIPRDTYLAVAHIVAALSSSR